MSSVTIEPKKLTLIEKPKNRKEWENNKAYYRQKFFSNKMKKDLEEKEHKQEVALKEIGKRQEYGTVGIMAYRAGNASKLATRAAWEYKKESMGVVFEKYYKSENNKNTTMPMSSTLTVIESEIDSQPKTVNSIEFHGDDSIDNTYLNLNQRSNEVVDSWEDLC